MDSLAISQYEAYLSTQAEEATLVEESNLYDGHKELKYLLLSDTRDLSLDRSIKIEGAKVSLKLREQQKRGFDRERVAINFTCGDELFAGYLEQNCTGYFLTDPKGNRRKNVKIHLYY